MFLRMSLSDINHIFDTTSILNVPVQLSAEIIHDRQVCLSMVVLREAYTLLFESFQRIVSPYIQR